MSDNIKPALTADEWEEIEVTDTVELMTTASLHSLNTTTDLSSWTIRYGGGEFIDGVWGWVYHYDNPTGAMGGDVPAFDHPWGAAWICPRCWPAWNFDPPRHYNPPPRFGLRVPTTLYPEDAP